MQDWRRDFPLREDFEDAAGRQRWFTIRCDEGGLGFRVTAREEGEGDEGYEFHEYGETNPWSALGRLRDKIRRSLATRHLSLRTPQWQLLHGTLRGRIAWSEEEGIRLVVDGLPLTLDELGEILSSHEGWQFRLEIVDPGDDISR